jgi:plasmid stability protein
MLATMASILIRDVPDDVRAELAARAARKGQSMQEFLRSVLVEMVEKPDIETWVAQVRRHIAEADGPGPSADDIVESLREARGSL